MDANTFIEIAKKALLREASTNKMHICRMKPDGGSTECVKVKHRYMGPEEVRLGYLAALDSLISDGLVRPVLSTNQIELFEISSDAKVCTLVDAKRILLNAVRNDQSIYKIHSTQGEYLQTTAESYNCGDEERILFLSALHDLVRQDLLQVSQECREYAVIKHTPETYNHELSEPIIPVRYA